ncbi:hypothetical protein LAB1_56450 [Roseibium sp. LAB1]
MPGATGYLWLSQISIATTFGDIVPRLFVIGIGAALVVLPINTVLRTGDDHGRRRLFRLGRSGWR